ncbi:hypothetical protein KFU94_06030 [Chloroflexi bacterium TSY]|nr:hypothetical protein [Chloroflexi bacterium TSY]
MTPKSLQSRLKIAKNAKFGSTESKEQRRQQRKLKMEIKLNDQHQTDTDTLSPATAAERRAALMDRYRQSQWNQKVRAGKAAAARVEKRYNRGG